MVEQRQRFRAGIGNDIVKAHAQGLTNVEISELLDVRASYVSSTLIRLGLERNRKPKRIRPEGPGYVSKIPVELRPAIVERYRSGDGVMEIIKDLSLDVTRQAVDSVVASHDQADTLRSEHRENKQARADRKRTARARAAREQRLEGYRDPDMARSRTTEYKHVTWTDDELLELLRRWVDKYGRPCSTARWDKIRDPDTGGSPA
jgi:hypothetical protein